MPPPPPLIKPADVIGFSGKKGDRSYSYMANFEREFPYEFEGACVLPHGRRVALGRSICRGGWRAHMGNASQRSRSNET